MTFREDEAPENGTLLWYRNQKKTKEKIPQKKGGKEGQGPTVDKETSKGMITKRYDGEDRESDLKGNARITKNER